MSSEILNREYNNQAKVKNFRNYPTEWRALSTTTVEEYPNAKSVTYDTATGLELDLIYPETENSGPFPVHIFFHGGYWKAFDKEPFKFVARAFAENGIATAIVDYQLIPNIRMAELIRQCRQSVAHLFEHAEQLNIDQNELYVSGHSAGGHIAAMCLATKWEEFSDGLPSQIIKSATGISGLYDLNPISQCFLQNDLKLTAEEIEEFSPALLSEPNEGQMHIILGSTEGDEYHKQSEALFKAWPNRTTPVQSLSPYNHFTIMSALADPTTAPSKIILNAMGAQ